MNDNLKVLNILFNINEKTTIGHQYENRTFNPFLKTGEFFSINPISDFDHEHTKKPEYSYQTPRRSDLNVCEFRNFLFEMDDTPLNEQLEILKKTKIPFSSIIYSGGKSYHAILSLETGLGGVHTREGVRQYKRVWEQLAGFINGIAGKSVCDTSCKNPSRFSRFPGFQAEGRKKQTVVEINGRISESDFGILISKCPKIEDKSVNAVKRSESVDSMLDFWKTCSLGLRNSIRYPTWASEQAGLYPKALRIVLWAIDETGVERDLLCSIFEKTVFRQYERVGYPRDKWYNAIDHAYGKKD